MKLRYNVKIGEILFVETNVTFDQSEQNIMLPCEVIGLPKEDLVEIMLVSDTSRTSIIIEKGLLFEKVSD
jgi:hypothetical protein